MKERSLISHSKSSASKFINLCINNTLNNISCPERLACYLKDNKLTCIINNRNIFIYDLESDGIEKQIVDIDYYDFNEFRINVDKLKLIAENIVNKKEHNSDVHAEIREKFGITKKTIKKKDIEEIQKYKQAMKNKYYDKSN